MRTLLKLLAFLLLLPTSITSEAQDINYARALIDTLASPLMYGRGYVNKGDSLAASYLALQFGHWELKSFGDNYYQPFSFNVNSFPEEVNVSLNGNELSPGDEFVVSADSHSDNGIYPVKTIRQKTFLKSQKLKRIEEQDHSGYYIFFDLKPDDDKTKLVMPFVNSFIEKNPTDARGFILPVNSIWWHVWAKEMKQKPSTAVKVRSNAVPGNLKTISINVKAEYLDNHIARNVIAWIPGKTQPDSFLVVTAHYDHIGMMGPKALFPGANDNASGTAMLTDLARHYSLPENHHDYSIAFMAFAGEEAGLLGSKYYTKNPLFPLEKIKFLLNLDMVGTGGDGLMVFNGTSDSLRYDILKNINDKNQYLKELRIRSGSANIDHYYFHEKGVPAFFLLTFGSEHRFYHDIYDTRESLPLTKYNEVFRLITEFFNSI